MNMAQAFPVRTVRLGRKDSDDRESYQAVRVDGGRLVVQAALSELRLAPPIVGEAVVVECAVEEAIFRVPMRVVESATEEAGVLALVLEPAGEIDYVQRREKHRAAMQLPAALSELSDGSDPLGGLRTQDIHSAGARVRVPRGVLPGTTARVWLDLGASHGILVCRATVVRCEPAGAAYDLGLRFSELADNDRDRLVTFLLRRMLGF